MLKFEPNKIGYNADGCMAAILKIADGYMSQTSEKLMEILKTYIDIAGNGSTPMKEAAKKAVNEKLHEVTADHINIEAGFIDSDAAGMSEEFFVKAMVVIYGNQAGGALTVKPGAATWKKNVTNYGVPEPDTRKTARPLPGFNQYDVSEALISNTMKDIKVYFEDMIEAINAELTGDFFGAFITGG